MENAFKKSYLPLLQTIMKFPKLKVSFHFSGSLLSWLSLKQPDYLSMIKELYLRKQVEVIGGGFYEPIFAAIPVEDLEQQVQKLSSWWWRNYRVRTQGVWIAERVWNPELPIILNKQGIKFTFIDDYLFKLAGIQEAHHTYVTEFSGKKITIFPINEQIRYLIPWKDPQETIKYLKNKSESLLNRVIVLISDAEKMGVWPAGERTTYDICYVNGYSGEPWLSEFFKAILENNWIKTIHFSEYSSHHKPKGLIYLPTSSYDKMAIWALPTSLRVKAEEIKKKITSGDSFYSEELDTLISGALWQNFLVKYPESNIMHKRMLYCRSKVINTQNEGTIDKEHLSVIWDNILASQANDAYWHGLFGGIYYKFLRHTIHKHIITAEHLLDNIPSKKDTSVLRVQDILFDGHLDAILENEYISCYISPLNGGSIFCLNLKDKGYNFLNVMTRRKESYHYQHNLDVIEDRFLKWMFQDHFVDSLNDLNKYFNDTYVEYGNFAGHNYDIISSENTLMLKRAGSVKNKNLETNVTIYKKFSLELNILYIDYQVEFEGPILPDLTFIPELNLTCSSFPYKTSLKCNSEIFGLEKMHTLLCHSLIFRDLNEQELVALEISFPVLTECIIFPIYVTLLSENGLEEQYQGSSIFPLFRISEKTMKFQMQLQLFSLNKQS